VAIIDRLRQSPTSELAFFSGKIQGRAISTLLQSVGDTSDPVKLETFSSKAERNITEPSPPWLETELFAQTYKSYALATVRFPALEVTATVEPFENERGFSLRVWRAGKPRTR
jgi:hypothetical protein